MSAKVEPEWQWEMNDESMAYYQVEGSMSNGKWQRTKRRKKRLPKSEWQKASGQLQMVKN